MAKAEHGQIKINIEAALVERNQQLAAENAALLAHIAAQRDSRLNAGVLFIPDTMQFAYPKESLQAMADATGMVVVQGPESEIKRVRPVSLSDLTPDKPMLRRVDHIIIDGQLILTGEQVGAIADDAYDVHSGKITLDLLVKEHVEITYKPIGGVPGGAA